MLQPPRPFALLQTPSRKMEGSTLPLSSEVTQARVRGSERSPGMETTAGRAERRACRTTFSPPVLGQPSIGSSMTRISAPSRVWATQCKSMEAQ